MIPKVELSVCVQRLEWGRESINSPTSTEETYNKTYSADLAAGRNTTAKRPRSVSRLMPARSQGLWNLAMGDRFIMVRHLSLVLLVVLATGSVQAQDWAKQMFTQVNHDFGTVARGAKTEFVFEFVNKYKEDVHIVSVETSCHCTTPTINQGRSTIKTWEKGGIKAVFNTGSFMGQRAATVTVTIDKPFPAKVLLNVKGNIRGDIEIQPGLIEFASVEQGSPQKTQVTIKHHNRRDWVIKDVRSANAHLEVELSEAIRQGSSTSYVMTVHLKPTSPAGVFQDQMTLVTNDNSANVPVLIQGNVKPLLGVNPAMLFLGVLKPGESVTKQLVVSSTSQPFKISRVQCTNGDCFKFDVKDETKKFHLVPVTFTAGKEPAEISAMLQIETDLPYGGVVSCPCKVIIKDDAAVAVNEGEKTTVFKPAQ